MLAPFAFSCSAENERSQALPGDGPAYLAATRIWNDTETTSYFHLLPSADAETTVDPKQALEVPGAANLYSLDELGWFAIGTGESPTITRYTLNARGELEEGTPMSLMGYGVDDLWDTLYAASARKAYYPDTSGSQLIAWDPTKMQVLGSTALPETMREGYLSYYGLTPIRRGKYLIFSVGWFDWLEEGGPERVLTVPGFLQGIARVR